MLGLTEADWKRNIRKEVERKGLTYNRKKIQKQKEVLVKMAVVLFITKREKYRKKDRSY
jgi:hypothetical protein